LRKKEKEKKQNQHKPEFEGHTNTPIGICLKKGLLAAAKQNGFLGEFDLSC